MDRNANPKIQMAVKEVVDLLVAGEYGQISLLTGGLRLSEGDIARAILDYGRTLRALPSGAYESLDVVQVKGTASPVWSVRVDLWTVEEGRSDLSVEMTMVQDGHALRVELDDIHVL